jgi:hypothetical protein
MLKKSAMVVVGWCWGAGTKVKQKHASRLRVFTFRTTTALATNHSITNSADEIYVGYILHFSVYAR